MPTSANGLLVDRRGSRLLDAGIVAGPMFVGLGLLQAFTVDGFDLRRHPISLLSLAPYGWIQIANFVVSGALVVACAIGLRRTVQAGLSGTWGPRLVGAFGVGLVVCGVFPVDPTFGFPPGAPDGPPSTFSPPAILHSVGGLLALLGAVLASLVFARRFASPDRRGWVATSIGAAVLPVALVAYPGPWLGVRFMVATAISFTYLAALAMLVRRGRRVPPGPPDVRR